MYYPKWLQPVLGWAAVCSLVLMLLVGWAVEDGRPKREVREAMTPFGVTLVLATTAWGGVTMRNSLDLSERYKAVRRFNQEADRPERRGW